MRPAHRRARAAAVAVAFLSAAGCSSGEDSPGAGAGPRCFLSTGSTLGRMPNDAGGNEVAPGWLRLDGAVGADSGSALFVDGDGASMAAQWRRIAGDSIHVVASNDFLRVEYRALPATSGIRGTLHTRSDAALERDSTGQLRELNRQREMTARVAPCDSMPRIRNT